MEKQMSGRHMYQHRNDTTRLRASFFCAKKSKREGLSVQKRAWADSGPLYLSQKVKSWGPECAKEGMSVLRASILCSKVKKGGPERVQRGPEGLSLFQITPEKACSFFAPLGARCCVGKTCCEIWDMGCVGRGDVIRQHKDVRPEKKRRSCNKKWMKDDSWGSFWQRDLHCSDEYDYVIIPCILLKPKYKP